MAKPKKPTRTGRTSVLLPYNVETISRWTLNRVKCALDAHETGDFSLSAQLVDAMGRDDRITACGSTRIKALTSKSGLAFEIAPSEFGPKARNQKLADQVSMWWFKALPETVQGQILWWGIMLGVAIAKVDWSRGAEWVPTVRVWPMQHVMWDQSAQRFAVMTTAGRILIDPEDPEWLIYKPYGDYRPWMGGLVRCLGIPFLMRQLSYRDWARFSERHGLPLILIKEPAVYDEESKAAFAAQIENLGTNGVARLPQPGGPDQPGFDIEFREAKDTGWETFKEYRNDLNTSIAIVLLGQNLTTEVQGGSFAAARVQDRVRADYLAADAESLSTCFRTELILPWLAYNFGFPEEQAPWPEWESSVPDDLNAKALSIKTAGEAIQALQVTKIRVDYDKLAEDLRLPLLPGPAMPEEEPPPPPAPPPAPPAPPPEGDQPPALHVLASGDSAPGFVSGQHFADELVTLGTLETQRAIAPTVEQIIARLGAASSFDEARAAIVATYAGADTAKAETLAKRVQILAQLAGRAAVVEDL